MKINLRPYTIILTNYPEKEKFFQFFDSHEIVYKYFSLSIINKQLLQDNSTELIVKQSIDLMLAGIDNYTQYPVNTKIIVIDSENLTVSDKTSIEILASNNNYFLEKLCFETEKIKEEEIAGIIFSLKELPEIELSYYSEINNSYSVSEKNIAIVGDVHGCLDELVTCVIDNKGIGYNKKLNRLFKNDLGEYYQHVLLGDFIDKGPKIKETIEFLHLNKDFFVLMKGNHEYWVYQYLNKKFGHSKINDELISKYFNSITILENDPELKEKFFELFNNSYDFVTSENAIVTHAPCEKKYLGKTDKVSIKKQRNIMYPKRSDFENYEDFLKSREKAFSFLIKDADLNLPYHIFGHTPITPTFEYKNKICIDTGCVSGGSLTNVLIKNGKLHLIKSYESLQEKTEMIIPYFV